MIILETGINVSVVVRDQDLLNGNKRFYAFSNNGYYDPENGFKPCFKGASERRRLYDGYAEEYKELLAEADETFNSLKEQYKKRSGQSNQPAPQVVSGGMSKDTERNLLKMAEEQAEATKAMQAAVTGALELVKNLVPQQLVVKTPTASTIVKGITHEKFETVLNLVNADIPVFLTGAAGTGKNVICKQVAEAMDMEFYFTNAVTQEYKLTGFIDANGTYHETQFYKAFTQGGLFMLDEMDASVPEVLIILNAAIANRYFDFPTGRVEANENFRLIAAGNTYGTGADMEYSGRYQLDAASLDRFAMVTIDYSEKIEMAVSGNDTELVTFIHEFRAAVQEAGIKHLATYRSIERITKLKDVMPLTEVVSICLLKGLGKDDVKMLVGSMSARNKYTKAMVAAA